MSYNKSINNQSPTSPLLESLLDVILCDDNTIADGDLSDTDMDEAALLQRMRRDRKRLKLIRSKQHTTNPTSWSQRKKFRMIHDAVQVLMVKAEEECNAKGYAYGIIRENEEPVSVASDNLKAWWQDKVRFHRNAPDAMNERRASPSLLDELVPEMLDKIQDSTLGSLLSALMRHCNPPQRAFPLHSGTQPRWWPTTEEEWWADMGLPTDKGRPPYKKPHDLKKEWKVAVIISVVKHIAREQGVSKIRQVLNYSTRLQEKLTAKECELLSAVLDHEERAKAGTGTTSRKRNADALVSNEDTATGMSSTQQTPVDPSTADPYPYPNVMPPGSLQEANVDNNVYVPQIYEDSADEESSKTLMDLPVDSLDDQEWLDNMLGGY